MKQIQYEDLDEQDKKTIAACKEVLRLTSEHRRIQDHLDLMIDEFERIKGLLKAYSVIPDSSVRRGMSDEIFQLCDRAITNTKQRVPVIVQRNKLQSELDQALRVIVVMRERIAELSGEA